MPHLPSLPADVSATRRRAVFLDRDGTLMEEAHYCADPGQVRVLAGVVPALRKLKTAGFSLVIVTNQSGIGRGYFGEAEYQAVHAELLRQFADPELIDATYHCPDAPGAGTNRRKPGDGMLREASQDLGLESTLSFIIGDSSADVLCGQRAGLAACVLVLTGHGREHASRCQPDFVAADFAAAAEWILGREDQP